MTRSDPTALLAPELAKALALAATLKAGLQCACSHLDAHAEEYQHVTPRETRAALRALAEGKDPGT